MRINMRNEVRRNMKNEMTEDEKKCAEKNLLMKSVLGKSAYNLI